MLSRCIAKCGATLVGTVCEIVGHHQRPQNFINIQLDAIAERCVRRYQGRVLLQPEICETLVVNIAGSHVEALSCLLKGALVQTLDVDVIDGELTAFITFDPQSDAAMHVVNLRLDGGFEGNESLCAIRFL